MTEMTNAESYLDEWKYNKKENSFEEWPCSDQIIRMLFILDCIFKLGAINA